MVINATVNKAPEKQTLPAFTHRPDHDGESIFWTLLHSFVEALPLNGCLEPSPSVKLSILKIMMFDHCIEGSVAVGEDPDDTRDDILHWCDDEFDNCSIPICEIVVLGHYWRQWRCKYNPSTHGWNLNLASIICTKLCCSKCTLSQTDNNMK